MIFCCSEVGVKAAMMINTITASTATPLRIMIVWDRSFSDRTAGCSNIDSSRTYRHTPNQERGRNDAASEIEIISDQTGGRLSIVVDRSSFMTGDEMGVARLGLAAALRLQVDAEQALLNAYDIPLYWKQGFLQLGFWTYGPSTLLRPTDPGYDPLKLRYGYLMMGAILSGFFIVSIGITVIRGLQEMHHQQAAPNPGTGS